MRMTLGLEFGVPVPAAILDATLGLGVCQLYSIKPEHTVIWMRVCWSVGVGLVATAVANADRAWGCEYWWPPMSLTRMQMVLGRWWVMDNSSAGQEATVMAEW